MPISKYFGGHGEEVMSNMQSEYGAEKGKSVFYATANKRGEKPGRDGVRESERPAMARWHDDGKHKFLLSPEGLVLGMVEKAPLGFAWSHVDGRSKIHSSVANATQHAEKEANVGRARDYSGGMAEKHQQWKNGDPVHNSAGVVGEFVKVEGDKVIVSVNGRRQEWDLRRTFRANDSMNGDLEARTDVAVEPVEVHDSSAERDVGVVGGCRITMYPSGMKYNASQGIHGDVYTYVVRTPDGQRMPFDTEEKARAWCRSYATDSIDGTLEANTDVAVQPVEVHDGLAKDIDTRYSFQAEREMEAGHAAFKVGRWRDADLHYERASTLYERAGAPAYAEQAEKLQNIAVHNYAQERFSGKAKDAIQNVLVEPVLGGFRTRVQHGENNATRMGFPTQRKAEKWGERTLKKLERQEVASPIKPVPMNAAEDDHEEEGWDPAHHGPVRPLKEYEDVSDAKTNPNPNPRVLTSVAAPTPEDVKRIYTPPPPKKGLDSINPAYSALQKAGVNIDHIGAGLAAAIKKEVAKGTPVDKIVRLVQHEMANDRVQPV